MAEKFARTTKESTRFLLTADCYLHNDGYKRRGEIIVVGKDTPISKTWTEVDDDGNPVEGGHVGKPISRHVERPTGDERSIAEIAEAGATEAEAEADEEATEGSSRRRRR